MSSNVRWGTCGEKKENSYSRAYCCRESFTSELDSNSIARCMLLYFLLSIHPLFKREQTKNKINSHFSIQIFGDFIK